MSGQNQTYQLNFGSVGNGAVLVAVNGVSVTSPATVVAGASVVAVAVPNSGHKFTKWSDGESDNPYLFTMSENKALYGSFELERATGGASMIYNYEAEVLKWLHNCFPEVKQAIYASNEDLLLGGDTAKYYPAFYYSRDRYDVSIHRPIHARSVEVENTELYDNHHKSYVFYPYWVDYSGTMLIENQQAAFRIATTLKYYWAKIPKVTVVIPGMVYKNSEQHDVPVTVDVSLILQDILIEDIRLPNDKNGACRAVKMKWKSQLLLNNAPTSEDEYVNKAIIGLEILNSGDVIQNFAEVTEKPKPNN